MRPFTLRLLAVAIGVGAGVAGTELLLRVGDLARGDADLRGLHVVRPDRPWLYGLRAGADLRLREPRDVRYRINADGFRDRIRSRPKPDGAFRILALGDSVTFGYGVEQEETYPMQLEAAFAGRAAGRIEVLNLGVGGYNPYTEAMLFADLGPAYQPDLVLVQFCINDLNDPTLHFDRQTRLDLGSLPAAAFPDPARRLPPPPPDGIASSACRWLRVCERLHDRLGDPEPWRSDPAAFAATLAPRDGPGHATEWGWLRARYREIAEAASREGARLVVVAFPFAAQLEDPRRTSARDELVRIGHQEGWETIDLLGPFLARARSERLLADAWHPTAAGHRLAAEVTARELACRGLVPVAPGGDCHGGP
jgi:lysophospholipase L1-like esterase